MSATRIWTDDQSRDEPEIGPILDVVETLRWNPNRAIVLEKADGSLVGFGGTSEPTKYLLWYQSPEGAVWEAHADVGRTDDRLVSMLAGGQQGWIEARRLVDIDTVMDAVREFHEFGRRPTSCATPAGI
ncbi:MAG TPA: Imm1 family immunity protein [Candidatus Limnocylindrales bacterium]|nr:Imm1 family immunity protein [Candidatus Limnocylindrales bacterium]